MIYPVTGWFEIAQYEDKDRYQPQTWLKLRICLDILYQHESRMTKERNVLVTSSENP